MYLACRVCLTIAFVCSIIFLLAGRADSQIQFSPNQDLPNSPVADSCESAVAAKVQTDHDALAHFDSNTKVQQDMVGQTRMGGSGDYFLGKEDTRFTFNCVFDEKNKTITSGHLYGIPSWLRAARAAGKPSSGCQEKTFAKVYATARSRVGIISESIKSKTKKNGNRIIYGDGVLQTGFFRLQLHL